MGGEGVGELLDTRIARPEPVPDKAQTRTSLAIEEALVFRGDGLVFSGAVTDSRGRAVNEGTVQLLLLDGLGRPVRLLGTAKLDGNGRYQTTLTVPVEQAPGAYSVVADFLGDDTWSPSSSE